MRHLFVLLKGRVIVRETFGVPHEAFVCPSQRKGYCKGNLWCPS